MLEKQGLCMQTQSFSAYSVAKDDSSDTSNYTNNKQKLDIANFSRSPISTKGIKTLAFGQATKMKRHKLQGVDTEKYEDLCYDLTQRVLESQEAQDNNVNLIMT